MFNFSNLQRKYFSKLILVSFLCIIMHPEKTSSQETLAEKLGYNKDAKLLIIHADDLGFSHAENEATIKSLEEGAVNSSSIIMPGPWVSEIASYVKQNDNKYDIGLHLSITSEWKNYKWGPVASKDKVPTLVNKYGYFMMPARRKQL